jgi:hypothetical protein
MVALADGLRKEGKVAAKSGSWKTAFDREHFDGATAQGG